MRLQYYEAVRNVWRHRIGGDLGGTRLGEHQLHFGEFLDCLLDLALHYQGLFQTDGRHAGRGEREVLLIELRNELRAEQSEYRNRRQEKARPPGMNGHGRAIALSSSGRSRSLLLRMSHTSFSATWPRIRRATSAGTRVIARTKAATSANMMVIAIGEKVLPSTPVNMSRGAKARRMIA